MTQAPEQPVALRSLTDLVEIIPALLGFHPDSSLVLIAVEDGHVAVTARVDLGADGASTTALRPVWHRFPGASFMAVTFDESPLRAWRALEELDAALPSPAVRTLVHADGERWFDHPDAPGTPYDALGSVHLARAAWTGRPVRRSRAELGRLIEPSRTPAEVTTSLERVAARGDGLADVVADARALVVGHDEAPGVLDLDEATLLCLATHDPGFLEEALLSTTRENAATRTALWTQVVGASVPSCAGGALVALGLAGWLDGDGALQTVCLEALAERPGPAGWVELLDRINLEAIPPAHWERMRDAAATPPDARA